MKLNRQNRKDLRRGMKGASKRRKTNFFKIRIRGIIMTIKMGMAAIIIGTMGIM